jgi:hypothetical protein
MGWAIGAVALFGIGFLYWLLRSNNDGPDVSSLDDGHTRIVKDGFFIHGFLSGGRVRWRARVGDSWKSGVADIAGAETFVYTGGTPTEIQIEGGGAAVVAAPVSSSPPSSDDDDDSPFAGIPSAY